MDNRLGLPDIRQMKPNDRPKYRIVKKTMTFPTKSKVFGKVYSKQGSNLRPPAYLDR